MIIDCIADLHGNYPKMEGGDVLIVAGDLTASNKLWQYVEFRNWLLAQKYTHKIVVAGNHDTCIEDGHVACDDKDWFGGNYLRDEEIIIEGVKFYGSPWTAWFPQVNPHCTAFMKPDNQLQQHWDKIPEDVDVLITHGPPFGILDRTIYENNAGSKTLAATMGLRDKPPKLWVWGHIHEAYGEDLAVRGKECKMINCSHVNQKYKPVNKPIRVVL